MIQVSVGDRVEFARIIGSAVVMVEGEVIDVRRKRIIVRDTKGRCWETVNEVFSAQKPVTA